MEMIPLCFIISTLDQTRLSMMGLLSHLKLVG